VPIETNFNEIHMNSLEAEGVQLQNASQNVSWDRKDCFVIIVHKIASFNKYFFII